MLAKMLQCLFAPTHRVHGHVGFVEQVVDYGCCLSKLPLPQLTKPGRDVQQGGSGSMWPWPCACALVRMCACTSACVRALYVCAFGGWLV